jgi:outer membrane protein assembly factor BamB
MIFLLVASLLTLFEPVFVRTQMLLSEDAVIGTWTGVAEHGGETSPIALEFARTSSGDVRAVAALPAIHSRVGWGRLKIDGGRVTVGPVVFEFDQSSQNLTAILPAAIVPRHQVRVTLHRDREMRGSSEFAVRDIPAPVRQPLWTADLQSPIWSDIVVRKGQVVVGADDGRLHALDASSGAIRWTFVAGGAIRARPVFAGSDIVVQADDGWLYRIDGATGRQRWRVQVNSTPVKRLALDDAASRYETHASAATVDRDRIYVGTHDGALLALHADSGRLVWTFKTGDAVVASPVVDSGRVYCGSFDHYLYALDAASGALIWKHDAGEAVTSTVAVYHSNVLVGSRSYDFEALDAMRGTPVWTKYFWFSWVESSPAVADHVAFIGSSDAAKLFAIDAVTGRTLWEADAGGSAWGQPAVTDSTVYAGVAGVTHYLAPHRGTVIAVDRTTGRPRWWFPAREPDSPQGVMTPYGFAGSVAAAGNRVFAGGLDGRVYAFAQ